MMAGASSISPRKLTHSLKNEWDEEKKRTFSYYMCTTTIATVAGKEEEESVHGASDMTRLLLLQLWASSVDRILKKGKNKINIYL